MRLGEVKMKKSSPILVGFLYRNPSEPANWVNKFVCMMDSVWLESKEIILMGDFNIDLSKANKSWIVIKASHFSKSAMLDGSTHLLHFEIVPTWVEMMSEADDALLHVHLDHMQLKSQS